MSVVACDMYRIEVSQADILPVLVELELLDVFEPVIPLFPIKKQVYQSLLQDLASEREEVSRAVELLYQYVGSSVLDNKPVITEDFSRRVQSHTTLLKTIVSDIQVKAHEVSDILKEKEFAESQKARFEAIKDSTLPVYAAQEMVKGTVVVVDKRFWPVVQRNLDSVTALKTEVITESSEALFLAVVYHPEYRDSLQELLDQPFCQELELSNEIDAQSPSEAYLEYDRRIHEIMARVEMLTAQLTELAKDHIAELAGWHDLLLLQEKSLRSLEYVGYTPGSQVNTRNFEAQTIKSLQESVASESSVISGLQNQEIVHIDGWVDPTQAIFLQERIARLGLPVTFTQLDASNDPEARTVLRNNRIFRPFEVITNLMGTPHTSEIDPSPYVAPFFILFFGFALGDAGYGLLMIAIVLYFYRNRDSYSRQLRNVLGLMMYCGVSTTIFGILTGGWFGLDLGAIGQTGVLLNSLKVLDVQSNIILLLIVSLFTGFIHQLFGLVLAIKSSWQAGRVAEAIQVPGTWLLFLLSLAISFAITTTSELQNVTWLVQPILGIASILFLVGQGYGAPWWMRPFKGFLSIFNLTSYLSNTLSYARLLALALATGVIASVVNMIAVMAGEGLPLLLSIIVMAFVAVIGHTFNIVLNLMGTFINVARLHLVEFFPRFFEAKGMGLAPLHNEPTYSFFSEHFSTKELSFDQFKSHEQS